LELFFLEKRIVGGAVVFIYQVTLSHLINENLSINQPFPPTIKKCLYLVEFVFILESKRPKKT